jgi:hypothetical protein
MKHLPQKEVYIILWLKISWIWDNNKFNFYTTMNEEKGNSIDLRSEELHEVLGAVPQWILRWGVTFIGIIAVILLVCSWFFKYPETLPTTMVLTGKTPPAAIVAKTNGRLIKLYKFSVIVQRTRQSGKSRLYASQIKFLFRQDWDFFRTV